MALTTFGLLVWLGCAFASHSLAEGVAALPQANQDKWVAISNWLPAIPIGAAMLIGTMAMIHQRQLRQAALAASWGFLWFSVGVLILVLPKPI